MQRRLLPFALALTALSLASIVLAADARADGFGFQQPWLGGFGTTSGEQPLSGDFDGDGRADVATLHRDGGGGYLEVARASGAGFQRLAWFPSYVWVSFTVARAGDVDGDGDDDIVLFVRDGASGAGRGDVYVLLSYRTGFAGAYKWHDWFCIAGEIPMLGDVDGDGDDDIISFVRDTWGTGATRGDVWVALSNRSAFVDARKWHEFFSIGNEVPAVGDFDGDTRADIATFVMDTAGGDSRGDVYVSRSSGSNFGTARVWHGFFGVGAELPMVGDFDGNGCDDIATFIRASVGGGGAGDAYVALSDCRWVGDPPFTFRTASRFKESALWSDDVLVAYGLFSSISAQPTIADFDADGRDDVAGFSMQGGSTVEAGRVEVALTGQPTPQQPWRAVDFGQGAMKINGTAALGSRPLMVLLVDFSDQPLRAPHNVDFYRNLFFGPGEPSVNGLVRSTSQGRFQFTNAGVFGPFRFPDNPDTGTNESARSCWFPAAGQTGCGVTDTVFRATALWYAATQGVDYKIYDQDRDGTVEEHELVIYVVDATPPTVTCAANRSVCQWVTSTSGGAWPSMYQVCNKVAGGAEGANLVTIAHELMHSLGAVDLYSSDSLSAGGTLMSSTCDASSEDGRGTLHLDPWHKLQLGWVEPRIYPITGPGGCELVQTPQSTGNITRPILLFDPRRGSEEFFLLEARSAGASLGTDYDSNVPRPGVAMWRVKQTPSHTLARLPGVRILAGANGVLDTRAEIWDTSIDSDGNGTLDTITRGWNLILDSVPTGDDVYSEDPALFVERRADRARGVWDPYDATLAPWRLTWLDGNDAQLELDVAQPGAPFGRFALRWGWYSVATELATFGMSSDQLTCETMF